MVDRDHRSARRRGRVVDRAAAARLFLLLALLASTLVGAGGGMARSAAAQDAADLPESAALVPETALAYVSLSTDRDGAQWRQAEELLARAGLPNALEDFERSVLNDQDTGAQLFTELEPFYGGEIALVVSELPAELATAINAGLTTGMPGRWSSFPAVDATPVAGPDAGPGVVGILRPGDPDAAWETVQAFVEDQAADRGATLEETTYREIEIRAFAPDDEVSGSGTAIARLDDTILVAATPTDLEPIIETATGDGTSLADLDAATEVRGELNEDLLAFGYVNYRQLADVIGPELYDQLQAQAQLIGTPVPFDQAFDLDLGIGIWADEPGLRFDAIALSESGATLPLQAGLVNREITFDERVPADSLFFQAGDAGALGAGLAGAAAQLAPMFGAGLGLATPVAGAVPSGPTSPEEIEAAFAEAEQALGFDPRADLIERFAGEYAIAASVSPLGLATGAGVSAILAAGVDDAATVADSVQKVARLIERRPDAPDVSARRVDGDTVYTLHDEPAADGGGMLADVAIEFGVVADELLVGVGTGIDDWVAGPTTSLADDDRYQRVLATLPDEYAQIQYVNLGQIIPLIELAIAASDGAGAGSTDASPDCAGYASQAEAQAALDAGDEGSFALDQDFDGEACEDFFAPATPVATPSAVGRFNAVEAFASVTYVEEDRFGVSSILYIGEP